MTDLEYSIILFILYVLLSLSVLGTLIIPIFFNDKIMKPKNKREKDHLGDSFLLTFRKRVKGLNFAGKLFIICGITSVIFGWFTSYIEGKLTDKNNEVNFSKILQLKLGFQDSISNYKDSIHNNELRLKDSINKKNNEIIELQRREQVANVQKSVDNANNKLASKSFQYENLSLKLQSTQKENEVLQKAFNSPIISEYIPLAKEKNPSLIFDTLDNRFIYTIAFRNSGKGIAKNIRIKAISIYVVDSSKLIKGEERTGQYLDKYLIMKEGDSYNYIIFFEKNSSPCLISLVVKYQNSFNEEEYPYRNIYEFDPSLINKQIPKLNKYQKASVEKFLLDNKIWSN